MRTENTRPLQKENVTAELLDCIFISLEFQTAPTRDKYVTFWLQQVVAATSHDSAVAEPSPGEEICENFANRLDARTGPKRFCLSNEAQITAPVRLMR